MNRTSLSRCFVFMLSCLVWESGLCSLPSSALGKWQPVDFGCCLAEMSASPFSVSRDFPVFDTVVSKQVRQDSFNSSLVSKTSIFRQFLDSRMRIFRQFLDSRTSIFRQSNQHFQTAFRQPNQHFQRVFRQSKDGSEVVCVRAIATGSNRRWNERRRVAVYDGSFPG